RGEGLRTQGSRPGLRYSAASRLSNRTPGSLGLYERTSDTRDYGFVTRIRVIISSRHCFRSVLALKGPQNVASGNARRVPDLAGPTLKGLQAFRLRGATPSGSVVSVRSLIRPAAQSASSLKVWSVGIFGRRAVGAAHG